MDAATLISRCRQAAGLSQRELARRAGTSAAAVCLYETGGRVPGVDTLARLLAAAGATLELAATPPPPIDTAANARTLAELLDLADQLPQRSARTLDTPPFATLVRRP